MKTTFLKEQEIILDRFLKVPATQKCEIIDKTKDGFRAEVELEDGYEFVMYVYVMKDAYPALVKEKAQSITKADEKESYVIMAPYISETTAEICRKSGMGFFDYAGNCLFYKHSIYLYEKGNKNKQSKKRGQKSVFERTSEVSSVILRVLFQDINRSWKLIHLAEQAECSIGQVAKVKDFLCKNAWAEMTGEGLMIREPEQILHEWSKVYGERQQDFYACYSLESISEFEKKLIQMKKRTGIDYYLTGFSGGVRYVPAVRYNRVHVYIEPENVREAIKYLECKEVESGHNIIIFPIEEKCCVRNAEMKEEYRVVSPVQIYLDCMQLKGRGEEMAEAVMMREIFK